MSTFRPPRAPGLSSRAYRIIVSMRFPIHAPAAAPWGMRVVTYDPYLPQEIAERERVEQVEFDELIRISDYISIHTPLLPATRHLFNTDVFRRMKPEAYLINTARGPII